ncbi:MAG: succinate dehydrogenase iron-sulfur subunit [Hydrogenibacillus schlegelii]|uniref:succinate dehydrogenase n=1 Tax=Hydrogenibacillus schlegelii TaxID=1484 RepID=A0A947CXH3_HYDSH|nr:succinate dehydrogenase iron-sulfur subunit [Hydrogenibacillus schlegelii]
MSRKITLIVTRQDGPDQPPYKETFVIDYRPNMNVIGALMEIRKNPVNAKGERVAPVAWEMSCLEEVCGACSMVINGKARQACSALIDKLGDTITLEPMRTFPVVRDLIVDRSRMFEDLKKVKAWVPIDGTYDIGPGPRMPEVDRQMAYELSRCMMCGVCLEVCPNVSPRSKFMGAAIMNQVRLHNTHPTGAMHKHERLEAIMGEEGLEGCGNSQNCVQACPKGIPLTTSIAALRWETTRYSIKKWMFS